MPGQEAPTIDGGDDRRIESLGKLLDQVWRPAAPNRPAPGQDQRFLRATQQPGRRQYCRCRRGRWREVGGRNLKTLLIVHPHYIGGNFDMDWAWPLGAHQGKGARQHIPELVRVEQTVAPAGNRLDDRRLIGQFVEQPMAVTQGISAIDARDHQHRNRIRRRLRHCGQAVGEARASNHKGCAGFAGHPRIAVGHEAGTLLVSWGDVTDAGLGEAAVKLHRMDAGNAKTVSTPYPSSRIVRAVPTDGNEGRSLLLGTLWAPNKGYFNQELSLLIKTNK